MPNWKTIPRLNLVGGTCRFFSPVRKKIYIFLKLSPHKTSLTRIEITKLYNYRKGTINVLGNANREDNFRPWRMSIWPDREIRVMRILHCVC
jgi:hypothetical protein